MANHFGKDSCEEMNVTQRISLVPLRHTKTVHFIRHARGFHNVAGERDIREYRNPKYFDAHLTEMGWQQIRGLRKHLTTVKPAFQVDLVIVSPMTRTLETACGLFGSNSLTKDEPVLMVAQDGIEDVRTAHGSISATDSPPVLTLESCREYCDAHPCDRRRSLSYYKLNFPQVNFSHIESEDDPLWTGEREDRTEFVSRVHRFLEILRKRPESEIAVVSHAGFLRALFREFGSDMDQASRQILHKNFENCEMRSVILCEKFGSEQPLCPVSHPGGMAALNGSQN